MDDQRFDAFTRALSGTISRRGALRRLGLTGVAGIWAAVLGRPRATLAHHCTYEGCGCATGTNHPCGHGLVCCPSSPGTPGGAGVCTPRGECGGGCIDQGSSCPGHCSRNDGCGACCTGYCGHNGRCDSTPGLGGACTGGTVNPCLYGLICCPYVPGLAGGAGVCEYTC